MLLFSAALYAQEKTPLVISGKNKGNINTVKREGELTVDALAFVKKLGGEGSFSAQSKQLRLHAGAWTAVLTAGSRDSLVDGEYKPLSAAAFEQGGKIYAPLSLFIDNKFFNAISKTVVYENGSIIIEKIFNLSFDAQSADDKAARFKLAALKDFKFSSQGAGPRKVTALIESAVLKRDVTLRFAASDFIYKAEINQCAQNVCVQVLLNKKTNGWSFGREGDYFVFSAPGAAKPVPAVIAPVPKPVIAPVPAPVIKPAEPKPVAVTSRPPVPDTPKTPVKNKKLRVVIDAGHGGKDPGAVRARVQEKEINLDVSKQVSDILKKRGIEVKMTRTTDVFLPLHARSKASNDFNADVFVSIHTNAGKRAAARGFSVYFRSEKATDAEAAEAAALENEALQYEETSFNFVDMLLRSLATNEHINESSKLAGYVRRNVKNAKNLGVPVPESQAIKQANFYVLKGVNSPAILVEMAFISNTQDRKRLQAKDFRKKMAQGVADGILEYAKSEGYL